MSAMVGLASKAACAQVELSNGTSGATTRASLDFNIFKSSFSVRILVYIKNKAKEKASVEAFCYAVVSYAGKLLRLNFPVRAIELFRGELEIAPRAIGSGDI